MLRLSNIIDRYIKSRVVSHTSFWMFTVILLAYHGSLFGGNFKDNLLNMLALLPVQMLAAYSLIYYQIPQWLYKGYYLRFGLSLLIIAYLLAVLARLFVIFISEQLLGLDSFDETLWEILSDPVFLIKVFVTSVYIPAILLFLIKMTKERFEQQNQLITLEKERRITELDFLKAQMNPHFLFNTLNNIYSLSKRNSEHTSEMILKLSEILDYTIYECNDPTVPILKEWELIESYIDLETLRYSDELMIVLDKQIDDEEVKVAPLILISLVENAFKYSLKQVKDTPYIKVFLKVEKGMLTFEVINSKAENILNVKEEKRGIGVQNVKRQLSLQYPDRHIITINDQRDSYDVKLIINL